MTRITKVLAVPATGAYYYEDLSALQSDAAALAEPHVAPGASDDIRVVREVAQAVSVGLVLDDSEVAWGDCVAMAVHGKGGRATAFRTASGLKTIQEIVAPSLTGRNLTSFRELAAGVDALTQRVNVRKPPPAATAQAGRDSDADGDVQDRSRRALLAAAARLLSPYPEKEPAGRDQSEASDAEMVVEERQLHPAVRYGVSQALLRAVALARGLTMAEVIADEWNLLRPDAPVAIHAQSGSERYINADKMIVRRVSSLPDAFVDNIQEQVGEDGVKLTRYVNWLRERIQHLSADDYQGEWQGDYRPTIHLDLHGALGLTFEDNLGKVLGHLYAMELAAGPYPLRVESPVIMDSREAQIKAMRTLREYIRLRKMKVQLVADEWVDAVEDIRVFAEAGAADMIHIKMPNLGGVHSSVEAVLACQSHGVGALLGGSCAETAVAARVAVHVALATRPVIVMAKPGLGVDEAISIVQNEMARALTWIQERGT